MPDCTVEEDSNKRKHRDSMATCSVCDAVRHNVNNNTNNNDSQDAFLNVNFIHFLTLDRDTI